MADTITATVPFLELKTGDIVQLASRKIWPPVDPARLLRLIYTIWNNETTYLNML